MFCNENNVFKIDSRINPIKDGYQYLYNLGVIHNFLQYFYRLRFRSSNGTVADEVMGPYSDFTGCPGSFDIEGLDFLCYFGPNKNSQNFDQSETYTAEVNIA